MESNRQNSALLLYLKEILTALKAEFTYKTPPPKAYDAVSGRMIPITVVPFCILRFKYAHGIIGVVGVLLVAYKRLSIDRFPQCVRWPK